MPLPFRTSDVLHDVVHVKSLYTLRTKCGATCEPWWPRAHCVARGKNDARVHRGSLGSTTGWTPLAWWVVPACLFPYLTSWQCCFYKVTSTSLRCVLVFRDYLGHFVALRVATCGVCMTSSTFMGSPLPLGTRSWLDKSHCSCRHPDQQPVDTEQKQPLPWSSYCEFSVLKTTEINIKVLCSICRKEYSTSKTSSSNLRKHLEICINSRFLFVLFYFILCNELYWQSLVLQFNSIQHTVYFCIWSI